MPFSPKYGIETDAKNHRADIFRRRGFEQIRAAAGAIANVIADKIRDDRGVARIVFRNSRLHFANKVGADVRRFGIDAAAELGEERDEGRAKAVPDDGERNFLRIMAEHIRARI